jgi:Nucleotidyltransferase
VDLRAIRARNRDGSLVDLARSELEDIFKPKLRPALTELSEDLEAAAIFGLAWLINSPKMEGIVIDQKGYPVRMVVIDPRAFCFA